jgi:hypothetical protein
MHNWFASTQKIWSPANEPRICSGVFQKCFMSVLQDNGVVPGTVSQRSGPIYRRIRNVLEPLMAYSVCTDESCSTVSSTRRRSGTFCTDSGGEIGHGTVTAGRRGTAGETRDAGISRGSRSTMKIKMRGQPRSLHHPAQKYQGRCIGQRAAGSICAVTKCASLASSVESRADTSAWEIAAAFEFVKPLIAINPAPFLVQVVMTDLRGLSRGLASPSSPHLATHFAKPGHPDGDGCHDVDGC